MKKTSFVTIGLVSGLLCFALSSCTEGNANSNIETKVMPVDTTTSPLAKFEPRGEKVLVFAGQDLESIGGLSAYNNGYADHFPIPAGVTLYTGIGANDGSFGGENEVGLLGLYETFDGGNGPSNMKLVMEAESFLHSMLAIGLSLVNNEQKVAAGELDGNIKALGDFLLSLGERPVFLRIGYEFDGHPWNHYDKASWKKAYQRIKDQLDSMGVDNTAYVWQSVGWVSDPYELEEWYPGDEYVDWCAFSFFDRWREVQMLDFARKKGKPVFIAEASATISTATSKFDGKTKETILGNPEQAAEAWEKWFVPFFNMIENNTDVIKAIHYINCDWKARPMWFENPTFQDVDARIQESPDITAKWQEKMKTDLYLNASAELLDQLNYHNNN
ncbi:MAG: endo-1,3-beta-xylanase [Saprospiraceae bacterium]|nr:endo-1,3-beta-xylanase [Saprospiraceae bacterium]